ncbi:MAG: TIGR01212 family radical SAM protein [Desulfobulbaceae bacterium]|nr:TIGR01212 family radical SAM protein [Desulfobulbaceae bacterium]
MKNHPVNTFSLHYRRKYGHPVGKIPLDIGLVCPNREYGGCIYCRPGSFTPSYLDKNDPIAVQLEQGKKYLLKERFRFFFGYFQQETSTALPAEKLLAVLAEVLGDGDCVGIILSTRPDSLDPHLLAMLSELALSAGKEFLLEIGLQSVHDRSLQLLNRNHSVQDFVDAVALIHTAPGLQIGVHLILGIPGESEEDMRTTLRRVCDLGVDALKLHHLQVIRDTLLHAMDRQQKIPVFTAHGYLKLLTRLLPEIPRHIVIHRLWSHSHPDLLVAPRWDLFAGNLSVQLREMMAAEDVYQGRYVEFPGEREKKVGGGDPAAW